MKRLCRFLILAIVLCLVVGALFVGNTSFAQSSIDPVVEKSLEEASKYEEEPPIDVTDPKYIAEGNKQDLLNNEPSPIFEGNTELESYYDINQVIDVEYLKSVDAQVCFKEVMTYAEYRDRFEDNDTLSSIADDHLVWVLSVFYPGEYKTKRMTLINATVTGLYDAENGFYFGYTVTGEKAIQYSRPQSNVSLPKTDS